MSDAGNANSSVTRPDKHVSSIEKGQENENANEGKSL
jgi:hypothetical protein